MIKNHIEEAARVIRAGGLVAFPTETVYGLGADALNPVAVAKIFQLKERPSFDPLIVHIACIDDLERLTTGITTLVRQLADKFWPGPLTMVLPRSALVPDIVTSGLSTVGVRMPENDMALQLIRAAGCPIAAPSANKFGQLSPVSAAHVLKQLPGVDYILDGGLTRVGIESTIVAVEENRCRLLRPGFITPDDIEKALPGRFVISRAKTDQLESPGMLKSHYSPKKPLYLLAPGEKQLPAGSGVILHGDNGNVYDGYQVIHTSHTFNIVETAANLFAALHAMEEDEGVKQIFIQGVNESGLGIAIMDRIKKASYRYQSLTD